MVLVGFVIIRVVSAHAAGQAAAGVPLGCLARLLQAFDGPHAGPRSRPGAPAAAVPGLVEQLTSRELEVLRMLAAGRSNQAIAAELVVAFDTVKNMSAASWTSSAPPTAPRPLPAHGSWA